MDAVIRELKQAEYPLLRAFLYEAIFLPPGVPAPPKSIVDNPELKLYIENFGRKDDYALAAEINGTIVGAVWARVMNDYGHVDDETPSLAISLYKKFRGKGIGARMLEAMLSLLRGKEYKAASLSVQKENYAVKMYLRAGFKILSETDEEYIMIKRLN